MPTVWRARCACVYKCQTPSNEQTEKTDTTDTSFVCVCRLDGILQHIYIGGGTDRFDVGWWRGATKFPVAESSYKQHNHLRCISFRVERPASDPRPNTHTHTHTHGERERERETEEQVTLTSTIHLA